MAATLASLADDVYIITNRPDLVNETRVALRKAIFKFHQAETFARDLRTTRLQMALYTPTQPNTWRYQLDIADEELFPRFRRLSDLSYPMDLVANPWVIPQPLIDYQWVNSESRVIPVVAINNLFDAYRVERPQYAYMAGTALHLKLGWGMDYVDVNYWAYPTVPSDTSDPIGSWICDQYPDAVIEEASSTVFKMIGKDDEASRYLQLFGENLAMLKGTSVGEDAQ